MHSEIYRIAYQLSLDGKKPSVALIRARLSKPTSLPDIVHALQQWKLTPELGKPDTKEPAPEEATAESTNDEQMRLTKIEQRLEQLEHKVDHILNRLLEQSSTPPKIQP